MKLIPILLAIFLLAAPVYAVQDSDGNGAIDVAKGGTNATTAEAARTNLGVDAAGTDNSDLAGITPVNNALLGYSSAGTLETKTSLDVDIVLEDAAPDTANQITYDATNDALRVYDGSAVDTYSNDAVRIQATETLTNKSMSGLSNTFTSIPLGTAVTGQLLGSQIVDEAIGETKLDMYNSATDGYYLQYDSTNGLQWAEAGSGSGDITSVVAGSGLSGGATSGDATLTIDVTYTQRRVSSSCAAGNSIRAIAEDGTVTCEPDDVGSSSGTDVGDATIDGGTASASSTTDVIDGGNAS